MTGLLFMGVQEDPEIDVWLGRQMVRVYDATRPATDAERRLLAEAPKRPSHTGPRGALTLTGGGVCICGRCLFESKCPEVAP